MMKTVYSKLLPPAIFMTDENRHPDPVAIVKNLAPGTGVIFRHYQVPGRAVLARKIADICQQKKLLFLVAGDINLAKAVNADGVHFPEWSYLKGQPVSFIDPGWLITASVHTAKAIRGAEKLGANALLLAPIFPTPSHPERPFLGVPGFIKLATQPICRLTPLAGSPVKMSKTFLPLKTWQGMRAFRFLKSKT